MNQRLLNCILQGPADVLNDLWEHIEEELGFNNTDMSRSRPGTDMREATEIKGITFRDLRDCFIRAICLSASHLSPVRYEEALKGEKAHLCENDIYAFDYNKLGILAISQNLSCEVERLMGIFPNIPKLEEI